MEDSASVAPPTPPAPAPPAPGLPTRFPLKDRLASGAFLFGPLALWPVVLVVTGWRGGEDAILALGVAGLVAAGVPTVAAVAGWGWAALAAEFVCYGGMTCALISILKSGLTPEVAPAGAYFVLYAFLSHRRLKSVKAKEAAEPRSAPASAAEHPLEWAKENVEAIAVAFIMALVIRCFFIEVFKIPSSSMETTLLGDSGQRQGDRIMVTKYFYALEPIERYDVLVFKFPLEPTKNFIKRVVGLPDDELIAYRGNLYARPQGSAEPYRLQRKPLRVQRSIWQDAWPDHPDILADKRTFDLCFKSGRDSAGLTPYEGRLANNASSATCRFEAEPIQHPRGSATEMEAAFDADVTLQSGAGAFYAEFDTDFGKFRFVLSSAAACRIEGVGRTETFKMGALPADRTVHAEFFIADGAAVAVVDNRVQAQLDFCSVLEDAKSKPERSGLAFGSDDRQFTLTGLRVGRDVHYYGRPDFPMSEDDPVRIPSGNYFMIGDNVPGSHDSRAWKRHVIVLKNGETIECESQKYDGKTGKAKDLYIARTGKDVDYVIEADIRGHERAYNHGDMREDRQAKAEPFVPAKYIVGKALWIWWPPGRWFRLIR